MFLWSFLYPNQGSSGCNCLYWTALKDLFGKCMIFFFGNRKWLVTYCTFALQLICLYCLKLFITLYKKLTTKKHILSTYDVKEHGIYTFIIILWFNSKHSISLKNTARKVGIILTTLPLASSVKPEQNHLSPERAAINRAQRCHGQRLTVATLENIHVEITIAA